MKEEDVIEELISPEPRFPRRLTRGLTVKDTSGRKGHKKSETDHIMGCNSKVCVTHEK